jgi:hypothetical protein
MIRRLGCVGALVAAVLATSMPAAHAATVSPSKWAPKFCTALGSWKDTISQKANDVETSLSDVGDLVEARDKLVQYLGEMESATQDAIDGLKKAGTPSSPNGGKIAALFVTALKTAKGDFTTAKHNASNLPTNDPTAFATKGGQIGTDLTTAGDEIGKSFNGVEKLDKGKKLEKAVTAASQCAFLSGGSSA